MVTKGTGTKRYAKRLEILTSECVVSDYAFNGYAKGVTRFSLSLWEVAKKKVDITGFTQAKMTFDNKNWYKLTLTHKEGFKLVFTGVSSGYHGEGSRGAYKILTECGFSNSGRCFISEKFVVRKKAYDMPLKPFEVTFKHSKTGGTWTKTFYACNEKSAMKQAKETNFGKLSAIKLFHVEQKKWGEEVANG